MVHIISIYIQYVELGHMTKSNYKGLQGVQEEEEMNLVSPQCVFRVRQIWVQILVLQRILFFFSCLNFIYLFIYLFIYGCVGSSFLCEGFL